MVLVCHFAAPPYPATALSALISVHGDKSLCERAVSSSLSFYQSRSVYPEFSVRGPPPPEKVMFLFGPTGSLTDKTTCQVEIGEAGTQEEGDLEVERGKKEHQGRDKARCFF